jgi:hypothetical protein
MNSGSAVLNALARPYKTCIEKSRVTLDLSANRGKPAKRSSVTSSSEACTVRDTCYLPSKGNCDRLGWASTTTGSGPTSTDRTPSSARIPSSNRLLRSRSPENTEFNSSAPRVDCVESIDSFDSASVQSQQAWHFHRNQNCGGYK